MISNPLNRLENYSAHKGWLDAGLDDAVNLMLGNEREKSIEGVVAQRPRLFHG
jgi:hypothetical protein